MFLSTMFSHDVQSFSLLRLTRKHKLILIGSEIHITNIHTN